MLLGGLSSSPGGGLLLRHIVKGLHGRGFRKKSASQKHQPGRVSRASLSAQACGEPGSVRQSWDEKPRLGPQPRAVRSQAKPLRRQSQSDFSRAKTQTRPLLKTLLLPPTLQRLQPLPPLPTPAAAPFPQGHVPV